MISHGEPEGNDTKKSLERSGRDLPLDLAVFFDNVADVGNKGDALGFPVFENPVNVAFEVGIDHLVFRKCLRLCPGEMRVRVGFSGELREGMPAVGFDLRSRSEIVLRVGDDDDGEI